MTEWLKEALEKGDVDGMAGETKTNIMLDKYRSFIRLHRATVEAGDDPPHEDDPWAAFDIPTGQANKRKSTEEQERGTEEQEQETYDVDKEQAALKFNGVTRRKEGAQRLQSHHSP